MSYYLSLDETANEARDEVFESNGLRFVVEKWSMEVVSGLIIDVQDRWGREALVATHAEYGGTC